MKNINKNTIFRILLVIFFEAVVCYRFISKDADVITTMICALVVVSSTVVRTRRKEGKKCFLKNK